MTCQNVDILIKDKVKMNRKSQAGSKDLKTSL